jgi:hypothetical protein
MFDPNLLRGRIMRLPKLSSLHFFFLFFLILAFCTNSLSAQERPGAPARTGGPAVKKSAGLKTQTPPETTQGTDEGTAASKLERDDDADQIRKREEWFYRQRSSANGHIHAGARLKAFQHMQRMMEAEGKLVRHPDGTYSIAEAALTPQAPITPQWNAIGPAPTTGGFYTPTSGRVTTIAVDPSDSSGNTVLIGAAQGGIWRTTDAGTTWTPVGDQNPSLAMGSIAFANPASPGGAGVVYAGTGEQASIGFDVYFGAGVLKSTNGGLTWAQTCTVAGPTCPFIGPYSNFTFGFFSDGGAHISYVSVNPSNPNLVLVAAHIPQASVSLTAGGVYCSDNGGTTWSSIPTASGEMATFVGFAGATTAYAALGRTTGTLTGAANPNGIYKSTNADGKGSTGALPASCANITFSNVTTNGAAGVPAANFGRIDLGIAAADPTANTVYASIADATIDPLSGFSRASRNNLGVFKTTDGGTTWTNTNAPDVCSPQCWYDNVIKVDPTNSNFVFFGGGAHEVFSTTSVTFEWVIHSTDGGVTWNPAIPTAPSGTAALPHVDEHAMAFVKTSSGVRMYLGNDGGVWRTDDAEAATVTWTNLNNLPLQITQFYPSLSIHPSDPGTAFGGTQDNGSQNYKGSPIWTNNNACGDGGWTLIDPVTPSTVYILCQLIQLQKSVTNGTPHSFRFARTGISLFDPVNFIAPMAIDAANSNRLYFGTNKVYQTVDAATTWQALNTGSPLSTNGVVVALGVGGGNNGNVVYAGTSDGQLFVSSNVALGAGDFRLVAGFSQLPSRHPTQIVVDPSDPTGRTLFVTFSGFSVADFPGHVFWSANSGDGWGDASCPAAPCSGAAGSLPNIPVNDLVIDPDIPGTVYAATDLGVYKGVCVAASCNWTTMNNNSLPIVAVLSLKLHGPSRTLRAATHGRGVWDLALGGVPAFALTSLSPVSANAGDPGVSPFTLTGNGFSPTSQILFTINSATMPLSTVFVNANQLTATVPSAVLQTPGVARVSVKDLAQTTASLPFPVLALVPTLTSVAPPTAPVQTPVPSTSAPITVTGSNFTPNSTVILNPFFNGPGGKLKLATTFQSSTSLTAMIPASALGPFGSTNDFAVSTPPPGGGLSTSAISGTPNPTFKVLAPVPPNDNFSAALDLSTLTSPDIRDTSSATTEPNDPTPPCGQLGGTPPPPFVFGRSNTIWYKFTPTSSGTLNLDTTGASYVTWLSVWTGASQTALTLVPNACSGFLATLVIPNSLPNVSLTAGTTYYIMVGSAGPIVSPGVTVIGPGLPPNPIAFGGKSVLNFSFIPTPDFTMTPAAPTTVTVNAGSPATYTLAIGSAGGFASNVSVTCSLPAAATTCAASPSSVAPGTNTTITVTTMAHQLLIPSRPFRRFGPWRRVVPILALAALAALLLAFAARTRRQRIAISIPLAGLILFLVFQAAGCNGGSSGPPPQHGTQPGNYTVTITGNAVGTTPHTTTVMLIVN